MVDVEIKTDGPLAGPSGLFLPETALSRAIDAVVSFFGEIASWIWTVLMLLIVYQVVQRYVFGLGSIRMEEMQWHLYAVGFMLGLSLAKVRERHVRIDVVAERWPRRPRLWIEAAGLLLFALPFFLFVAWWSVPYTVSSWNANEVSAAPDGLPYRYLLKGVITVSFGLLALAAISRLSRVWAALRQPHGSRAHA